MRLPPIRYGVDIELPLAPCNGAPGRDRGFGPECRFVRRAVAGAVLVAAAGCATHDADLSRQFRIEPVYSVSHAVRSTASSQAYYTLGKYFDDMHEWGRAVDAYRQAVAADTANVEAVNALGVALAQGRHFGEAEATLRHAVDLAPERIHIRNNLGYLLLVEGRPQDAAAQLKVAVALDPGNGIALANLRNAMAQMGIAGGTEIATGPRPARDAAVGGSVVADAGADTAAPAPVSNPVAATPTAATEIAAPPTIATTAAIPTPAPVAMAPAALPPDAGTPGALRIARLEVSNGNGVNGMAAQLGLWLAAHGVATQRLTNQQPYDQRRTVIQFRSGQDEAARRLASLLPASAQTAARPSPGLASDVRVVLGQDWRSVADCLAHSSCRPASVEVARADAPTNQ
jgi:tetratricopeptide (TPR) repeat protein